jgi:5-formyltetrahydrofolate cyclo-ligase
MTKDDIRKEIVSKRDSLSQEELREKSRLIFEKVTATTEYQEAENILIYASMRSEVITDDIILDALAVGKNVFCPRVINKEAGEMAFIRIYSPEDLKEGYFGIREPELTEDSEVAGGDGLVIVPGVAFDRDCNRIGYRGGFYDRYLMKHRNLMAMAIAFECQVLDDTVIPAQEHDVAPGKIITESNIYVREKK